MSTAAGQLRRTIRASCCRGRPSRTACRTEEEAQEAVDEANSEPQSDAAWEYADEHWPEYLDAATTGTKFEQYTEDGGEDYHELLLTLPEGVGGNPEESYREDAHFGDQPVTFTKLALIVATGLFVILVGFAMFVSIRAVKIGKDLFEAGSKSNADPDS